MGSVKSQSKSYNFLYVAMLFLLVFAFVAPTMAETNSGAVVKDFLKVYNGASDKISQLAEAVPADKYSWRPAKGVRSFRESVLHVAGANYFMASLMGTAIPDGVKPRELEKTVKGKEATLATLDRSIKHLKAAIKELKADDFDTEVKFFGQTGTKQQVLFMAGDHMSEHLGQLIAYARMNGVVPPWSK